LFTELNTSSLISSFVVFSATILSPLIDI
jgi:hypothetical protein